ncbi:MAG: 2-oxo acid dehydrogenase subunit E2 [Metallibacterium scheffleri]|jgi:pyruvate dehydrogenase E2 component (dihydrolipoamide acetyltransferase)|uniref:dihydrolipoamide acetyltransferase family protein n=1 Tax=Metallibacterium scheffleri TaxID=993689 RepID=UPI0026EB1D56|nr:dihydrolipoamide acetyltransferase family protein [Metallibacterium scheffleri]MCK9368312.1 2-oxo acid dehydrogenase subunit E2 [Metallibacterium scheffleri]
MIEFKLPSLGSDMDQGKLLEWKIRPGDRVQRGQIVAVVDTSKAAVDIESWQEGTVHALLTQPEETIPVGTVMALFLAPGESVPATSGAIGEPRPAPSPAPTPKSGPIPHPVPAPAVAAATPGSRQKISPAARKRAAELKLDPQTLASGSGFGGAITVADIEQAAAAPAPVVRAATPAAGVPAADRASERAAEMRKTIAGAMSRSKREIPHYYLSEPIPLRQATLWLAEGNAARPMASRLLMAVVLLKAVAVTLKRFPELNGFFRDGALQTSSEVHVGVAISLRQGGLIAPAIHDVPGKSLDQLMSALTDLIQRARAGSLRSSELADPTVTVTSLGEQGVETVHGVIYPPQVAVVGLGRITERPWAVNGALAVLPVVTASLAADHRVSDGYRGARFLAALSEALQHPENL